MPASHRIWESSHRWPTIGVTKKLLCGRFDLGALEPGQSRPVVHEDRPIGVALRPTAGSRRPIFVSPGHRVDLVFAEQTVRRSLLGLACRSRSIGPTASAAVPPGHERTFFVPLA